MTTTNLFITVTNESLIKLGLANMRSLKNKDQALLNYILEHQIDVFLVTETWLKQEDENWKQGSHLNQNGKFMNCVDRLKNTRGGGIALIYNNGDKVEFIETKLRPTFETGIWRITIKGMVKPMVLVGIYHPPPSEINQHSTQEFINDFLYCYVELGAKFTNIIFLGDFNIHVLDIESIDGEQFTDMCEALGLQQHVTQPTHTSGHILVLVITEYGNSFGIDWLIHDTYFSDHIEKLLKLIFHEFQ